MVLKKALLTDLHALREICNDSYAKNFYNHWNENGLKWYLEKEFGEEKLKADLKDSNLEYYFIIHHEIPVGFAKIRYNAMLNEIENNAVELEKIYVLPEFKGKGIGKAALSEIIKSLRRQKIKTLFLYVIDTNTKAISFYKKLGFFWHSNTLFDIPYFKEELKGMHCMVLQIK